MDDDQNETHEEVERPPETVQDPSGNLTPARERPGSKIGAVHLQGLSGVSKMSVGCNNPVDWGNFRYLRSRKRFKVCPVLRTKILMTRKEFLTGAEQKDAFLRHGLPWQRELPVWSGTKVNG